MAEQIIRTGTVNIALTPEGCRRMKKMFLETKANSEQKITDTEAIIEEMENSDHRDLPLGEKGYVLIKDALDDLIMKEYDRIASMEEGIADIEAAGY